MVDPAQAEDLEASNRTMSGITFDTGALIALVDQKHLSMRKVFDAAQRLGVAIQVPTLVVAEWWRAGAREKERAKDLRAMHVVSADDHLARLTGQALTLAPKATTIDALVMVTAAHLGDLDVYTSDPEHLTALRDLVPSLGRIKISRA
jgi:predicted nucleic acid-binding protein